MSKDQPKQNTKAEREAQKRHEQRRKKRAKIQGTKDIRPAREPAQTGPRLVKQKRSYAERVRLRRLTIFLTIVFVAGFSVFGSYYLFPLETIEVIGNEVYDDTIIARWVLDDEYSWNTLYSYFVWRFRPKEEIPFVESVQLSITGRTSLAIEVYEKPNIGCIYDGASASYAYFDKDGFVTEMTTVKHPYLPEVFGITCRAAVLYESLTPEEEENSLATLLNLVLGLNKVDIMPETVTFEGTKIYLTYGDITVNIGNDSYLAEKTQRLSKILPYILGEKGVLHMEDWTYENTDIVFSRG